MAKSFASHNYLPIIIAELDDFHCFEGFEKDYNDIGIEDFNPLMYIIISMSYSA